MDCKGKISQPELHENDIIFRGACEGTCNSGGCKAKFSLSVDGKTNKNAKITGSGHGGSDAWIRISADDGDIDNGLVVLECSCGDVITKTEHEFFLPHRTTIVDEVKEVLIFLPKLIGKIF
jgi:hypothetical protein